MGVAVAVAVAVAVVGALVAEVDETRGGADADAGDVTDRAGVDEGGDGVVLGSAGGRPKTCTAHSAAVGSGCGDAGRWPSSSSARHTRASNRVTPWGLRRPESRSAARTRCTASASAHTYAPTGMPTPGGGGARGRQRHTGKRG